MGGRNRLRRVRNKIERSGRPEVGLGPPVQTQRASKGTRRLLAEDVFTSSVRRRSSSRSANRFRPLSADTLSRVRLPPPAATYCSRTVAFLFPASACILRPRTAAPLLAKKRRVPRTNLLSQSLTNEAGSLPFGARSVGKFISREVPCQARSCVFTKKFFIACIRCYVTSPKRRSCASDPHLERTAMAPHVERGAHGGVDTSLTELKRMVSCISASAELSAC